MLLLAARTGRKVDVGEATRCVMVALEKGNWLKARAQAKLERRQEARQHQQTRRSVPAQPIHDARMAWAMMARGERYKEPVALAM